MSRIMFPDGTLPSSSWKVYGGTNTVQPSSWTPLQLGFIPRPTGTEYVAIEDLGVSIDGEGLRAAMRDPAAVGKVVTLPVGVFEFNDYTEGDGGKYMHGLMINRDVNPNQARGIVGSGSGTIIQMAANSSHFTASTSDGKGSTAYQISGNQYLCSTIQFYNFANVEFGNLTVQGTAQPHLHHGIRINSNNAHIHHLRMLGAGYGSFNMPPGETYPLMVSGVSPLIEDIEIDGRRDGVTPNSSTAIGLLGCTNSLVKRSYMHDLTSGFGMVQWEGAGLTTEDVWVTRPGTGTSGYNGCHTNHEVGGGVIRHYRPRIEIDGYWGPTDGKPRRNNSKFGHFMFLGGTGGLTDTELYIDAQIIDPVYDSWGGLPGGFCILLDEVAINASVKPKVIVNGVTRTGVIRPNWWQDVPAIDTASQYWIGANSGNGSLWG